MKKRNFSFHFSKTCISAIMSEGYYHKGMIAHNSKKGADCGCAINSCFSLSRSAMRRNNAHRLSLNRDFLECFLQQCPERLGGCPQCTLGGGVRAAKRRTETHHIEMRILAQDDRALQSGMVYLHYAVLAVQFLVNAEQEVENL